MKLFTAILLGALVALSFGKDTVLSPDTTYIGNTVNVEIHSATKHADDAIEQRRHAEILSETKKATAATESMEAATRWMNYGTWVLAIFAVLAFVFSWRTFLITRKQEHQRSRAYVFVEQCISKNPEQLENLMFGQSRTPGGEIIDYGGRPERDIYSLVICNKGDTPARKVSIDWDFTFEDYPTPKKANLAIRPKGPLTTDNIPDLADQDITVGPGGKVEMPIPFKRGITQDELRGFGETRPLYIHGIIRYVDVFQPKLQRETEFCFLQERTYNIRSDNYDYFVKQHYQPNKAS